jgi:hypothetical protein
MLHLLSGRNRDKNVAPDFAFPDLTTASGRATATSSARVSNAIRREAQNQLQEDGRSWWRIQLKAAGPLPALMRLITFRRKNGPTVHPLFEPQGRC